MCGCLWEAAIMASIAVLFIFVTGLFVGDAETFLNVNCISSVSGRYGQTSVLQCRINTSNVEVENPQISWLSWLKDDEPVLLYNDQTLVPPSGYSFAQRSWKESLDVSLSIADTRVEHEGVYTCQVAVSGTNAWARTRLKVAANYSVPTVTPGTSVLPGQLTCFASGGYPKGHLRWFDGDGQERTESSKTESRQTKEGLFELSSRLTLPKGFNSSSYTCAVFSASGGREHESTHRFHAKAEGSKGSSPQVAPHAQIVAPVVVIGSLIVGLLVLLLVRRRRRRFTDKHREDPLEDKDFVSPPDPTDFDGIEEARGP